MDCQIIVLLHYKSKGQTMLDEEQTLAKYGYNSGQLSYGSAKKIVVKCDYCENFTDKPFKVRNSQNKDLDKDACNKCRFKKREELSLLKYGVKNSAQRQDVKSKLCDYDITEYHDRIVDLLSQNFSIANISRKLDIPQTSIKRYLVNKNIDTRGDLQAKKNTTCKEKYGDDYLDQFLQKRKSTNSDRYGCNNPFANEEVKTKISETIKRKYGCSHHMQNEKVRDRVKITNKRKYGYDNVSQVPEIRSKIKLTNNKVYGFDHATQHPDVKKKCISTRISNGNMRVVDGLSSKEWAEKTGYCLSRFNQLVREYGFETARHMYRTDSYTSLELRFKQFLDENSISHSSQVRLKLDDKVYIPDFVINNSIVVECDGLYWHSDSSRPNNYHTEKKAGYDQLGYDSLFFREDEIRDKFDIVKSIVMNKLGKSNRIYARKCSICIISDKVADTFFDANHIMGKGRGQTFVLIYDNTIVSAIRVKRLKNNDYEISRFCNLLNTSVVGGFSKLLTYCLSNIKPSNLITFVDRRYGKGDYLPDLGFKYIHTYPSFKWTDGFNSFHRLRFPANSGYDHGLFKIWDCGQAKFLFTGANHD
jgi:hypothetical protein